MQYFCMFSQSKDILLGVKKSTTFITGRNTSTGHNFSQLLSHVTYYFSISFALYMVDYKCDYELIIINYVRLVELTYQ